MSNGPGSFERALEDLIRRVVREEVASGTGSGAGRAVAMPATVPAAVAGGSFRTLNHALQEILRPTGQSEIMAAALRAVLTLAGRCALFVRRGDSFVAWRAEGYSGQTAGALRNVSVSATQPGIFKELSDTARPLCRQRTAGILPPAMEQALGSAAGPNLCLLPVVVRGKVVAAVYTDAGGAAGSEEMSGLEIIAQLAGLSLETAAGRAVAESGRAPAAESAVETPAATQAAAEPVGDAVALETPPAAAAMAAGEEPPVRGSFADSFPVAVEGAPAVPPPPDADALPEAERDSHKKAHRFARVAVQDLLSYHRDKIEQGRRNKNLFALLKEDIEKTRENYQKRFGQTPARTFDYLHYEMVTKLAGNDLSVLGDQYPGPWTGE